MASLPVLRTESPFSTIKSMLDEFFDEPFFHMTDRDISGRMWPRIDVVEEKDTYLVRADLPGIPKESLKVSLEGDVLTVSGEKKEEYKKEKGAYRHLERTFGSFSRSFTLPENVEKNHVDANYKDGVLELKLKKTGEPARKAKQIEIKG